MASPSYPAARAVAPAIRAHFARHLDTAVPGRTEPLAPLPSREAIEAMIDAAFWASLRREETYTPKISLAYLPPAQSASPFEFARPISLTAPALGRVAPAVERAGIHLGVWPQDHGLSVWGTTRTVPAFGFVLEVVGPGLLVVKHHRGAQTGKFANVAVLEGDRVKVIDERASSLPDCPPLVDSLLGFESPASWVGSVNVLVQLAVSMRAHGRGGLLLVVPHGSTTWRASIVQPLTYELQPAFPGLSALAREAFETQQTRPWRDALARAVEAVAGLTAVDGATVVTDQFDVLAFGAKIARHDDGRQIDQVTVTEPIEGDLAVAVHPSELGGTRHLSAAQFAQDQHDALALVASQDGRFTLFAWSPCEGMVHAHRVEVLLL